jgi:hypothetical protein
LFFPQYYSEVSYHLLRLFFCFCCLCFGHWMLVSVWKKSNRTTSCHSSCPSHNSLQKKKLHGLSPRANNTDRATAACRRSDCQLLRIESATWSAWRIPTAVFSVF